MHSLVLNPLEIYENSAACGAHLRLPRSGTLTMFSDNFTRDESAEKCFKCVV